MDQNKLLEENYLLREQINNIANIFNNLSSEHDSLVKAIQDDNKSDIKKILESYKSKKLTAIQQEKEKLADQLKKLEEIKISLS